MTTTHDDLWQAAHENLDIHVQLARHKQGDITDWLRSQDSDKDGVVALLSVAVVMLVLHGAEVTSAPERDDGPAFWRWLVALFRTDPAPAALDLVDDAIRNQLAYYWARANEWHGRYIAEHPYLNPATATGSALNLHLASRVDRDGAVDLLGAALLALTAVL